MAVGVQSPFCSLVTRRSIDLLSAMLDRFCGDAHLFLGGDLSQFDYRLLPTLPAMTVASLDLKSLGLPQKFVIVPLKIETISGVKRLILPRVGIRKRMFQVQIVQHNEMVFAAYDCFDPDQVGVINTVEESLLRSLVERKAIWSYSYKARV